MLEDKLIDVVNNLTKQMDVMGDAQVIEMARIIYLDRAVNERKPDGESERRFAFRKALEFNQGMKIFIDNRMGKRRPYQTEAKLPEEGKCPDTL